MSGIFGIIHRDGRPIDAADLERMRDAMAHRGPDGADIWIDGEAGLGQLMLCSTPESLDEQLPWRDPESGLVITADARVDNREELVGRLGGGLSRMNPLLQPDSRLILEAFKRWGEDCVDHLLGDFTFAIWDPDEKKLFCARDHMGIRPFHYYITDDLFVFGSSSLGVVASSEVPNRISQSRVADYMFWEFEGIDKTCGFFEDVWRMPPAHIASISRSRFSIRTYWQPDPGFELRLKSDEEYTDALQEVLTQSIRSRLRCHQPVASMLSGGLDSSTIVGIAHNIQIEQTGQPLATFSGVSEDRKDCRESVFSGKVIDHLGLDATLLRPSLVPRQEQRMRQLDQKLENPFEAGWILHKIIYLSARDRGHVAVMDGIDGEGVTSLTRNYPTFLIRDGHWNTALHELTAAWKNYHRKTVPLWSRYVDALRPLVPAPVRQLKRALVRSNRDWIYDGYLISPEYASAAGLRQRLDEFRDRKSMIACATLREAHVRRLCMPYLTAGIERYGRLASCCGVEQREPLLDKRVIEFCVSLPWQQLVRDGWSKYGLRGVAQRILPQDVAWRPGWDEVMWKFWSAWGVISEEHVRAVLSEIPAEVEEMLDRKKFNQRLNRYKIGDDSDRESILNLTYLVQWLNTIQKFG